MFTDTAVAIFLFYWFLDGKDTKKSATPKGIAEKLLFCYYVFQVTLSFKLLCRSAGHVEAEADTIVVLAELADLLDGVVAAEGRKDLKEVEELLRLEEQGDAAVLALGIAVEG